MLEARHPGHIDRLLGELAHIDRFQRDLDPAIVEDGHQGRAVWSHFLPAKRFGAARVGDCRIAAAGVIVAEQRVTQASLLQLTGKDRLVRRDAFGNLAHIGGME